MQVLTSGGEHAAALYLTDEEYQLLLEEFIPGLLDAFPQKDVTDHEQKKLVTRLMGEAGVRTDGVLSLRHGSLIEHEHNDKSYWFLKVLGKDTKDRETEGKRRDVWVNGDLKDELESYVGRKDISRGDKLFKFSYDILRDRFVALGEHLADLTGVDDWKNLRPHDCRRYFACYMSEAEVSDDVAMWLGGWEDIETYQKYQGIVSKDEIAAELELKGVDTIHGPSVNPADPDEVSSSPTLISDDASCREYYCKYCDTRNNVTVSSASRIDKGKMLTVECPGCGYEDVILTQM